MAINPVRYSTSSLPNSTLVGSVAFGWVGNDFGPSETSSWFAGIAPPSGGYTIYYTSASQITSIVTAADDTQLLYWANSVATSSFATASTAIAWLNTNGYAVATQVYSGNYSYSATVLSWPASAAGYTLYNGGFTSDDDGVSNVAVTLPTTFKTNNQASTAFYLSTNGYFTIGTGDNGILAGPTNANPATMAANPGDNWLQPGLVMTDGDTQNWYYKSGSDGGNKYYIKNIVYAGTYGDATTPTSYLINFYRDNNYQWLETRVKSNTRGNAGPYNSTDVSQPAQSISKVWRGDLNGLNWVYMGTGSVTF